MSDTTATTTANDGGKAATRKKQLRSSKRGMLTAMGGKSDPSSLRAKALQQHNKMQDFWKLCKRPPRKAIERVSEREVEARALELYVQHAEEALPSDVPKTATALSAAIVRLCRKYALAIVSHADVHKALEESRKSIATEAAKGATTPTSPNGTTAAATTPSRSTSPSSSSSSSKTKRKSSKSSKSSKKSRSSSSSSTSPDKSKTSSATSPDKSKTSSATSPDKSKTSSSSSSATVATPISATPTTPSVAPEPYVESQKLDELVATTLDEFKREVATLCGDDGDNSGDTPVAMSTYSVRFTPFGHASIGARSSMEDYFVSVQHLNEFMGLAPTTPRQHFYGVYDGHSGSQAAAYCRTHLHANLCRNDLFMTDWREAFRQASLKTDKDFIRRADAEKLNSGTTATCMATRGDRYLIGNVGDSQAILSRSKTAVELHDKHRPDDEDEKARIKAGGGAVVWYGQWRVNGALAVSRSIGDPALKHLVIADADCREYDVSLDTDEFVVIASDGLWDYFPAQEVVDFIHSRLKDGARTPSAKEGQALVQALVEETVKRRDTKDNVTAVIVFFDVDR